MNFSINPTTHLLQGDGVTHLIANKNKDTFEDKGGKLDTLIMHYTAGRSAESSAKYLSRDGVMASAHLVIGRGGEVYQLVPFNLVSWHAGVSSYGGKSGYNKYSIGIELDNAGILNKVGDQYQSWFGKNYPETEALKAVHRNETSDRYWHTYTEKQLEVNEAICRLILDTYPDIKQILGHEEVSPGRKTDPGPAFPLDKFRDFLLSENRESDQPIAPRKGKVDASSLNIRSGAGSSFEKVAKPLVSGQKVLIEDEKDGWYKVKVEIEGWVSKGYIKTTN